MTDQFYTDDVALTPGRHCEECGGAQEHRPECVIGSQELWMFRRRTRLKTPYQRAVEDVLKAVCSRTALTPDQVAVLASHLARKNPSSPIRLRRELAVELGLKRYVGPVEGVFDPFVLERGDYFDDVAISEKQPCECCRGTTGHQLSCSIGGSKADLWLRRRTKNPTRYQQTLRKALDKLRGGYQLTRLQKAVLAAEVLREQPVSPIRIGAEFAAQLGLIEFGSELMSNCERLHKLADRLDEPALEVIVTVLIAAELYPVEDYTLEELVDELRHQNRALFTYAAIRDHDALQNQARTIARLALQVASRRTPGSTAS